MNKTKEEIFELKDDELAEQWPPIDESCKTYVITDHMHSMPSSPVVVCLTREEALKAVHSLMHQCNNDLEVELDEEKASWFHTAKKDAFIRVKRSIAKKHSFEHIRDSPHLYEFKYEILERIPNKRYL